EQVVMNLAVNARDAMPRGGRLSIETANVQLDEHAATHRALAPGAYVVLRVTDTGMGMTPEVQAQLFEPFFTTKEAGKGTGLGMATVHGIVARSGGSVGVYSELGRGSAFSVYFPAAVGSLADDTARPAAAPPRAKPVTVLVVDDADNLRRLTRRMLERHGHTVLTAADAEEAEAMFASHPHIDVVLTDVVMPGASGPDLTSRLLQRQPHLRVIYMSGYTEDNIVHHGVLQPGVSFLHKPFTSEALVLKLIEVLGNPPAGLGIGG
ncbi:MAG: response regulator, partial [Acidobacteria bacterium]|nr:response regulator [Acidobacteriota bacterium]